MANREWRKASGAATILSDFHTKFPIEELLAARAQYQFGYHKTDKQGRPVYIDRIGRARLKELQKVCDPERFLMWHIYQCEEVLDEVLPACSAAAGELRDQQVSIVDLDGLRMGDALDRDVQDLLKSIIKTDSDNYPEVACPPALPLTLLRLCCVRLISIRLCAAVRKNVHCECALHVQGGVERVTELYGCANEGENHDVRLELPSDPAGSHPRGGLARIPRWDMCVSWWLLSCWRGTLA